MTDKKPIDAALAKLNMSITENAIRTGKNKGTHINPLSKEYEADLENLNTPFSKLVLENNKKLDMFHKDVIDTKKKAIIDAMRNFQLSKADASLYNIEGQAEDSGIFMRMGSAKFFFYTVLAIVLIYYAFSYINFSINIMALPALILAAILIFIIRIITFEK